jgi:N-acetylneuraminic acid mutarotase
MKYILLSCILLIVNNTMHAQISTAIIKGGVDKNLQTKYDSSALSVALYEPGMCEGGGAFYYQHELYKFGGANIGAVNNEIWKFNNNTKKWHWLKGSPSNSDYGVNVGNNMASSTNTPSGRKNFNYWQVGDYFYVYGGVGFYNSSFFNYNFYNDVWRYHIPSNSWICLKSQGNLFAPLGNYGTLGVPNINNFPQSRSLAAGWYYNNKLYIFGGLANGINESLNDLWEFDLANNTWTWLKGSNTLNGPTVVGNNNIANATNQPGSRFGIQFCNKDSLLYLISSNNNFSNNGQTDVWEYNTNTNNWQRLSGGSLVNNIVRHGTINTPNSTNNPGSIIGAVCYYRNNKIYTSGGRYYASNYNYATPLWQFDLQTQLWTWIKGDTNAYSKPRYQYATVFNNFGYYNRRYGMAYCLHGDSLFVFGGEGNNLGFSEPQYTVNELPQSNEIWIGDLANDKWGWIYGRINPRTNDAYKQQGVEDIYNEPNIDEGNTSIADYKNGFYYYTKNTALWHYNKLTNNWKFLNIGAPKLGYAAPVNYLGIGNAANNPGIRKGASFWTLGDTLYLFGGSVNYYDSTIVGGPPPFIQINANDMWRYTMYNNQWELLKGNIQGTPANYGTANVAASNNMPGGRQGAMQVVLNNNLYLFSGTGTDSNNNSGFYSDVWSYNTITNNWTYHKGPKTVNNAPNFGTINIAANNNLPSGRVLTTADTLDGKMYFVGGWGRQPNGIPLPSTTLLSDIWEYNPTTNLWRFLGGGKGDIVTTRVYDVLGSYKANVRPGDLRSHSFWAYNKSLYVLGGENNHNSLWQFNIDSSKWRCLVQNNDLFKTTPPILKSYGSYSTANFPNINYSASAFKYNNKLGMLGGFGNCYTSSDASNSIYLIDTAFGGTSPNNYTINLNAINNTTLCNNGTMAIYSGIIAADKYIWSNGDSAYYTVATQPGKYWVTVHVNGQILSDTILITTATYPNFLPNDTTICNNKSIVVSIPNHLYLPYLNNVQSSNNFAINTNGSYIVSASTANGCIVTDTIKVTYYTNNNLNLGNDTALCKNQTILLNTTINNATYLWSNGNTTNNYLADSNSNKVWLTLTDNNGCSYTDTVNIIWYNLPIVNLGTDKYICPASPGLALQTNIQSVCNGSFTWNGVYIFNVLGVPNIGNYYYTLTDCYGCSATDTISILSVPPNNFTLGNDTTICDNSNFALYAPNNVTSYFWSTGSSQASIIPTISDVYSVSFKDSFYCYRYDTIIINIINGPNADSIILNKTSNNCVFTLSNSQNIDTTKWNVMPLNMQAIGSTAAYNNLPNGTYTITATISNSNCGSKTISKIFTVLTDGIPTVIKNNYEVYYNNQKIIITANEHEIKNAIIQLLNAEGKILQTWNSNNNAKVVQLNNIAYSSGIYYLQIKANGNNASAKILIQ